MEQLYNSTIAAISTAMSNSGIGIVRMSGPEAFQIADGVYKGKKEKKLCEQQSHTIHYGYMVDGDQVIDEVLVMLMRGPHSYTGEDTVEINCHGGVYVVKRILELLIKNGARPAEPGEYTKRAFLNGRLDLSQAEADVIYQNIFRANRDVFQWIGFMLLFLVGYYAALSKTANYLKNIGDGIDNVLSNSKQPIELETELEPIAEKLNTMKMTLARKERMAQESEQRKNDLVVYLAHDLKTPLTSVIAYLSMLDEKPDMLPEERKKYIHIAHTKAIRLSELISEFFEITKFNLQNIRLEKETINLSLMLEQIMDEFYAVFADNNLTGNIYTEEDLMVEGDPDKLARVFDNLLRNAVAYSYRGTNIDVRAYGEGVAVVIVFSNQGEPIPKQKLQTVFEKFYRADNSRSSQTGGAGLGLSVAKEIVELHEGTIEAFSDIQSTRFVVRLKRLLPKGQRQSGGVI